MPSLLLQAAPTRRAQLAHAVGAPAAAFVLMALLGHADPLLAFMAAPVAVAAAWWSLTMLALLTAGPERWPAAAGLGAYLALGVVLSAGLQWLEAGGAWAAFDWGAFVGGTLLWPPFALWLGVGCPLGVTWCPQ